MGNEEKKINLEEVLNDYSMDELSLDELGEVTGGKISLPGYGCLVYVVGLFKKKGLSKEMCIQELTDAWNKGSVFKDKLTGGTSQDLQSMITFINSIWNL